MTLEAGEFIRRFLIHVLPKGFHRIRHYGLLANGGVTRAEKLARARELIAAAEPLNPPPQPPQGETTKTQLVRTPRLQLRSTIPVPAAAVAW
jgi:hypothetical protein